ncbi:MAG: DUF1850 domain-containing protein [Desulfomonilaceae bacterium]
MLAAVCILCGAALVYPVTALTVRPTGGGLPFLARTAAPGDALRIAWIHTVSNRPVSELYAVDKENRLCLREMVFDEIGPGMPAYPEDGTTWRFADGKITATGYNRCFARLHTATSPMPHRIEMRKTVWDLLAKIGPDRLICIAVERIPLILILLTWIR